MPSGISGAGVRLPRARIVLDGNIILPTISLRVTTTSYYGADSFEASVALAGNDQVGPWFWASAQQTQVDLQCSLDGGLNFVSLLQGWIDMVAVSPRAGLVHLEGRDLTSSLISTNCQACYQNQTASEIATEIALRHQLSPRVTATSRIVGRFDTAGRTRAVLNQFTRAISDWDLLVDLARAEGYSVYVQGRTLHFEPQGSASNAYLLRPEDVTDVRMERILALGPQPKLTIKSWNSWCQQQVINDYGQDAVPASGNAGVSYISVRPNVDMDQIDALAARELAEITCHQQMVELDLPGELVLTSHDSVVVVEATGMLDGTYDIETIDRRYSAGSGFTERIRAKLRQSGSAASR